MKIQTKCAGCSLVFSDMPSRKRKYCSNKCMTSSGNARRGKKNTEEAIARYKQIAEEKREQISKGWFKKEHTAWDHPNSRKNWFTKGSKPKNWQGGVTPTWKKIVDDPRYKRWRLAVFKRDNFKCVSCGSSNNLEADHIFAKSKYPDKAFDLDNGRTMCHDCHTQTPNYGWRAIKYENPLC